MKVEAKTKLKQLKTGVHLVCITDSIMIRDAQGKITETDQEGEMGITVRFSTGDNKHFDQDYWINGTRHSFFLKMCASAKIDPTAPKFKAEVKGKRLWICIKEVHDIDGDKAVLNELEEPIINYYLFDTLPCLDPNKKPIVVGDPGLNNLASSAFLDYRQINRNIIVVANNLNTLKITSESSEKVTTYHIEQIKDPFEEEEILIPKQQETKNPNEPINWDELEP